MKKLLFILAFAFIGQQAFSQMYVVTLTETGNAIGGSPHAVCPGSFMPVLSIVNPSGNIQYVCLSSGDLRYNSDVLAEINTEFNNIINQGYKLINTDDGALVSGYALSSGKTWYFAIPWTSSGLEEVPATLKSFIINPNPANTFVDISLDYSLKGESEVVFISEAGYIAHKVNTKNISKNEKYNIDISKIPAGKYLVTIVNGKTYTTPQKLLIF